MKKFEGNINGKIYTNQNEFNNALLALENTNDVFVSYKLTSVSDTNDKPKLKHNKKSTKNYKDCVLENEYVNKIITNEHDVELDEELINRLKNASNKSNIKNVVCGKIVDFSDRIDNNLLHINELKSDYKKLDEKIKFIESQINTLENANNNYYLNKQYYTNILNLVESNIEETKEECCDDKCKENAKSSIDDIYFTDENICDLKQLLKFSTFPEIVDLFLNKKRED